MALKKEELVPDFSLEDLFKAYYDCRKRKRNTYSALKFEVQLEKNLLELYHDLKSGKYKIGRYICFVVTSPKPREVWAANFRDRIVHHLVYNAIKDRFYKRFIKDTYSCIPKKGTLACARQMLTYSRSASNNYKRKTYFLKADLSNFFVSINKNILFELVEKYVEEDWILKLLKNIIFHNPKGNVYVKSSEKIFNLLPPQKSLWNTKEDYGLPIGNLTSQFFSNVYLDVLDKYVKTELRCKYYCRYVDDFIILGYSPNMLCKFIDEIDFYIKKTLQINLNRKKCYINILTKGMDFVGFFIKPHRLKLRKRILKKIKIIINTWRFKKDRFEKICLMNFVHTVNSYLGMLINTTSYKIRQDFCCMVNSLFVFQNPICSKVCLRI